MTSAAHVVLPPDRSVEIHRVEPLCKTVGGKREIAEQIVDLGLSRGSVHTYIELFLGGAAVYLELHARVGRTLSRAVLGDRERHLMDIYRAVQSDPNKLVREYAEIRESALTAGRDWYLQERSIWNQGERPAARTWMMRQGAFNAVARFNRRGQFNVPSNGAEPRPLNLDNMMAIHVLLQCPSAELYDFDFREYRWLNPGPGTLIYLDPPYFGGFTGYTPQGWCLRDLEDLLDLCATWADAGATVVLSHSDTEQVRALIAQRWPSAKLREVSVRRSVAAKASARGRVSELLVSNIH